VNATIDQQFIEFVVKSLVNKPDAVQVDRRVDEKGVLLELTVDPEDLGRVIGKRGATAQSLRTLLRALGTKNEARYNLKIVDNGPGDYHRQDESAGEPSGYKQDSDEPVNSDQPTGGSDATTSDDTATEPPREEPEEVASEGYDTEPEVKTGNEAETSDRFSRTRAELDELDDLDI